MQKSIYMQVQNLQHRQQPQYILHNLQNSVTFHIDSFNKNPVNTTYYFSFHYFTNIRIPLIITTMILEKKLQADTVENNQYMI